MATDQFTQVRNLVRHLSLQEKLSLMNELTMQIIQQSATAGATSQQPLPTIHLDSWPDDLPLRREELYDERGR
jgi:hypothetical protein